MLKVNENFVKLPASYLFVDINNKVNAFMKEHPEQEIIRLGIGDVTRPLPKAVVEAMCAAAKEMGEAETFRGYGPEAGYAFLREAIAKNDFQARGIDISADEIFVSDGAKSDTGSIGDIFGVDNVVAVCDPVYPVYVDDNVMAGRKILYLPATAENHFLPMPDEAPHADIVYICSPNNPTGATYSVEQLKAWVAWAKANDAVILFDAAYECFVTEKGLARSIFEVEGAKEVAIEVCSFSKIAGFTGTRCGYTIVPQALAGGKLNKMWLRRQTTKFNGVAYVVQRGAEAVFTEEGMREIQQNLDYYRTNAAVIASALDEAGIWYCGGKNSPYLWLRCPNGMGSWEFFDWLLENAHVVGTPGEGFGPCGKGYFRLTAFGDAARTKEAAARIKAALAKL